MTIEGLPSLPRSRSTVGLSRGPEGNGKRHQPGHHHRVTAVTLSIYALIIFAVLGPLMSGSPNGSGDGGNLFRQLVYIIIFLAALYSIHVTQSIEKALVFPISLMIVFAWFCLSMTWSIAPGVGARRLFLTFIIIWAIFLVVRSAGYDKTVATIRTLMPFVLFANYAAVLALPEWGIHQIAESTDPSITGAWRGIMMQKNFTRVN